MEGVEMISEPITTLADRFDGLRESLDTVVGEAITALEGPAKRDFGPSTNEKVNSVVKKLGASCLELDTWAADLVRLDLASALGALPLHSTNAGDVLYIVETCQMPVGENLRKIFSRLETNLATLLESSKSTTRDSGEEWALHYEIANRTAEAIAQSLVDLDEQRPRIREQLAAMTLEDIRRAQENRSSGEAIVLSMDGGGVESYSSILVIKAMMDQVGLAVKDTATKRAHLQASSLVHEDGDIRPRDVFSHIFGSCSGGLIAIMLGRLGMSVDQCLETFRTYADGIFSHPQPLSRVLGGLLVHKYSDERLIRATRTIIGNFDPDPDSRRGKRTRFDAPGSKCKTGVMARRLQDGGGSRHIFRSHSNSPWRYQEPDPWPAAYCRLWEVARATSAAPGYFSAINIDGESFVDAGLAINNPTREAWTEISVSRTSPSLKPLIISIGSGLGPQSNAPRLSSLASNTFITTMQTGRSTAIMTEDVHETMKRASEAQDIDYCRFDVTSGLEDLALDTWRVEKTQGRRILETIETITLQTESYPQQKDVAEELRRCAQRIVKRCVERGRLRG